MAQAAVRIVVEPLFEASSRTGSYGFRLKCGARQAIYDIRKWVTYGDDKGRGLPTLRAPLMTHHTTQRSYIPSCTACRGWVGSFTGHA
jgi:hypothetical protein